MIYTEEQRRKAVAKARSYAIDTYSHLALGTGAYRETAIDLQCELNALREQMEGMQELWRKYLSGEISQVDYAVEVSQLIKQTLPAPPEL